LPATFFLKETTRSQNVAWLTEECDRLQQGDASAAQEAEVWQQNAASWSDALLQQHPLYRDVLQPVGLAVYEVRCGLSLMVHAAAKKADQELANSTLADCMAFPSSLGQGEEDLLHHAIMIMPCAVAWLHMLLQWFAALLCVLNTALCPEQGIAD